jgi:hypothetical protein
MPPPCRPLLYASALWPRLLCSLLLPGDACYQEVHAKIAEQNLILSTLICCVLFTMCCFITVS